MKSKFFKYIFIILIVITIFFIIYLIYFKDKSNKKIQIDETKEENVQKISDLRLAISNFDTINPILTNNKEVLNIDKLIFEPLIWITQDYKTELKLAKECSKISNTSYIIKINEEVKWQDGNSFTAKDVEYTINLLKQGNSTYSYNVEKILNTELIDESTIKINLTQEIPFFEYNLTFPIMSSKYYLDEDFNMSTKIPIGTGMYTIYEITQNQITLVKNEEWWNKDNVDINLETINIKIVKEIGELYNSFKIGNIDIFTTSNVNIQDYIGIMGYGKQEAKGREYSYLAFNIENYILKNQEVRKALSCAIDKTNIISSVFNNEYYISENPLDYGNYLYNKDSNFNTYDIEQAKKILTDNGWEYKYNRWQKQINGYTTKLNFSITVNEENELRVRVAENIKEQLSQIGINISINKVSNSRYKEILENKNYEAILTGIYNSYSPDLSYFFEEGNLQNYKNDEIISILEELKNITDEKILKQKYQRIFEIYNNEQPFISLYRNKIKLIKDQNVKGEIKPNNFFSYYNLYSLYRV